MDVRNCKKCGVEFEATHHMQLYCPEHKGGQDMSNVTASRNEADRAERIPLGANRRRLSAPDGPANKVRRWVNDSPGRLADATRGGYTFVEDDEALNAMGMTYGDEKETTEVGGSRISRFVGTQKSGEPMKAYLMEIEKDWYEEDQLKKQEINDMTEAAIKRGAPDGTEPGTQGRYVPTGGIKIEHGTR